MVNMFTAKDVQNLRAETGCGMLECKKALTEADGDMQKAILVLRKLGFKVEEIRSLKEAKAGLIHSYIHGNKIGVLVEISCETDFTANTEAMKQFAQEVAMQAAAMKPLYLNRFEVVAEIIKQETDLIMEQCQKEGKPVNIIEKMVVGKVNKFYHQVCLMEQPYIRDEKMTLTDLLNDLRAKTKENVNVKRFVRWEIGE
jgi:elongation factor Ts